MKKFLNNLLALAISLIVVLILGEIIARVYLHYQQKALLEKNQGNILTRSPLFEEIFAEQQPAGFANKPNYSADWSGIEVRTDSLGCRSGLPAPDSARTILFIGDSMVFGLGLADTLTIPSLLQLCLDQAYPSEPCRVVNAGVAGYDFQQNLYQIERLQPLLKPALIVVGIANNDLFPTEDPFGTILAGRGENKGESQEEVNKARLYRSLAETKNNLLRGSGLYQLWQQVMYQMKLKSTNREKYAQVLAGSESQAAARVEEFLATVQAYGIPFCFVYFPEYENLGKEADLIYVKLLQERGQPVLSLSQTTGLSVDSYFMKFAKTRGGLAEPQMHFNAQGSRVVAQEIGRWLGEQGLWK